MSIANITNVVTGNKHNLFCDIMTCNNMIAGSVSPASITTPTATVNNLTVNNSYIGHGTFDQTLSLTDGSTTSILQSDNLLGSGAKGSVMDRINGNIRSVIGCVNAVPAGGPANVVNNMISDQSVPGNLVMSLCAYDGTHYTYLMDVGEGVDNCGLQANQGDISVSASKTISLNCTANDKIQLSTTSGITNVQGTNAVTITAPFTQITSLTNPEISNLVTSDNIGQLNRIRYGQAFYGPAINNINRITSNTSFSSGFTVIGDLCYVNCKVQVVVGAGVGSPSFYLSLPVAPATPFSTDVIFGCAYASDAGLTSTIPLDIATETPAGSQALITMTGGVAATYNCKFVFSYPVV